MADAPIRFVPTFELRKDRGGNWFFVCPQCRKRNIHGPIDGHRASHCDCWRPGGYYVTVGPDAPAAQRKSTRRTAGKAARPKASTAARRHSRA